jgi:integrase
METARKVSRHGHRDATMILVAYRHGLRASEVCDLQWHQVELDAGRLHVRRAKRGTPSVHPIRGDEIRALRKLQRENHARLPSSRGKARQGRQDAIPHPSAHVAPRLRVQIGQ